MCLYLFTFPIHLKTCHTRLLSKEAAIINFVYNPPFHRSKTEEVSLVHWSNMYEVAF
jgi:hypothetical protein